MVFNIEGGQLPIANAGADITLSEGGTAQLDGSASFDPMGRNLTYTWQSGFRTCRFFNHRSRQPHFKHPITNPDAPGLYVVSLMVNNGVGNSNPDAVSVRVSSNDPTTTSCLCREDITARIAQISP